MDQVLLSTVLGITILGSLLVWGVLFTRLRRGEALLSHVARQRTVPWNGIDVIIVVALVLFGQLIVASWFELTPTSLSEMSPRELARFIATVSFVNLFAFGCGSAVLTLRTGAGEYDLGLPRDGRQLLGDLGIGIASFLSAAPVVYLIQLLLTQVQDYSHIIVDMLKNSTEVYIWGVAGLSAAVVTPLIEEFIFRLVLQGWLEKLEYRVRSAAQPSVPAGLAASTDEQSPANHPSDASSGLEANPFHSPETVSQDSHADEDQSPSELVSVSLVTVPQSSMVPVVISSVMFAMMHLGQGPAPIPLFFLSLVLGYLYRQTHRLLPCVFLHMVFNGFSLVLLKLSV